MLYYRRILRRGTRTTQRRTHRNMTSISSIQLVIFQCIENIRIIIVHLMCLSMSRPTYPSSGRRWGFVGDQPPERVPRVGAFATRTSVLFHTDVISWIINRGFVIWQLSPGWETQGNLSSSICKSHLSPTWGRWGLTLIGA